MKQKRFVIISIIGAVILIGALAVALVPRPVTAARSFSPAALAAISAPNGGAQVSPFDLQCTVKIPGGLTQCGSQASSCKNCHEVQGEDPVNAKGEWHVSHAFGDFCEFCHGGNVQATDKSAAHEGLVQPLDDVKLNCSSCHAQDYQTKAEVYATALGVKVGGSGGATTPPASPAATGESGPQEPAEPAQPAVEPAQQTVPQTVAAPALPRLASNEIVDYVAQYNAGQPQAPSTGSAVTGLLLAVVIVGGAAFVLWNEMRLRAKQRPTTANGPAIMGNDERSQELVQLLPLLEKMDTQALRGLRTFLSKRS
jgi:hypothetical protein